MGFLDEGETLEWSEAKKLADYIRKVGIEQFLRIYETKKERNNDELKWGDEVTSNFVSYFGEIFTKNYDID